MNLDDLFRQTARRQPEHPAILGPGAAALSYRRLDESIGALARELQRAGVRPGACVGLHCPSGADYIVLNYAIWRCGGCVVPIPTELAAREKQEIVRQIALDFVVSSALQANHLLPVVRGELLPLSSDVLIAPARWLCDRPAGFDSIHSAFIRFTSGTTGSSKGIVLSHESILDRIQAANEALQIGPDDRIVWLLSMSYHFAVSIVAYLSFGATIVLPANHYAPAIVDAAASSRASLIYASPLHFALLADYASGRALANLRLALSTTTRLEPQIARKFHVQCGLPISQALGIIEVGLPCINLDFAAERSESVGRVLPAYEVRLHDVGLGNGLGEIAFRGKGFLDAYYHPWRTRREIMPDGWFRTGDIGALDSDGCLYLRGRSSDVINVMGAKFFPQEVEAALLSHPQVAEACVFGRRHSRLGEVPCARVTPHPGAATDLPDVLRRHCERHLASYKVPHEIELLDVLPRTASGKLLHRDLEPNAQ
jgi:long-chain acyl-CoA synthetase